jgi:16S rRNA (cytidine1402-2'-O)-methyltransferase
MSTLFMVATPIGNLDDITYRAVETLRTVDVAGTPGISDPGLRVVKAVRDAGFPVIPIPGPSAVATLISVAGYVGKCFTFEGFLSPRKGRRTKRLRELLGRNEAFVIYESPFRIVKTLDEISVLDAARQVVVGREMTKKFEEFLVGTAAEVSAILTGRQAIKGEFALCIAPIEASDSNDNDSEA